MKAHHFLAALLIILSFRFSYSQNEVERYKLPELIEGSNLYISGSPSYNNIVENDSTKYSSVYLNLNAYYVRWRFTRRLDYAADFGFGGYGNWSRTVDHYKEETRSSSDEFINISCGMDYYPVKDKFYGGLFLNSRSNFASSSKPFFQNDIYPYIGAGRLVNAGAVLFAKNFETALLDEGIISNKLPSRVIQKLTVLLDKRSNSEFTSKYKDDADIEFFSQIEKLLLDEKTISAPLNSRSTLKLAQALGNYKFVYFPRYRGYLVQLELGFNNTSKLYSYQQERNNSLRLILSGLYGLPIGMKTDIVFSCFAGFPLGKERAGLPDYPLFHSPLILREKTASYYPSELSRFAISQYDTSKYDYIGAAKVLAYYSISSFAGIIGYCNLSYGKTQDSKDNYVLRTVVNFNYNILSRLVLSSNMEFTRDQNRSIRFATGIDMNYIIF